MNQAILTRTPLKMLIDVLQFRWVSLDITNNRFPSSSRLWNDYKVFRFRKDISSSKAVKQMQSEGYEPANSHELVLWEGHNDKDAVVALGSVTHIGGHRSVLYLDKDGVTKDLYLIWWDNRWNPFNRFLAVRKPQVLDS